MLEEQGFAIWRPIPPKGYVCLGDVIHRSPTGEKPNRNIIRCIPEVCVERISAQTDLHMVLKHLIQSVTSMETQMLYQKFWTNT